jgi:hypothetical protein
MQNLDQMKVDWLATKEKLKEKFALLTEGDLQLKVGKHDEMIDRLQARLGKTREEMDKLISEL